MNIDVNKQTNPKMAISRLSPIFEFFVETLHYKFYLITGLIDRQWFHLKKERKLKTKIKKIPQALSDLPANWPGRFSQKDW